MLDIIEKEEEIKPSRYLDSEKWLSFKKREFRMSDHLVSWKYELITEKGEKKLELFQCDDCIKLELSF